MSVGWLSGEVQVLVGFRFLYSNSETNEKIIVKKKTSEKAPKKVYLKRTAKNKLIPKEKA